MSGSRSRLRQGYDGRGGAQDDNNEPGMTWDFLGYMIYFILAVSFFFRFYKISEWVIFGMDQEYQALISDNIVTGHHIPLIGVNASDTGIYLAPWFSYIAALFHALFSGNPLGSAAVASATGVLVTYLIYRIGTKMYTQRTATIAALVYASSFLVSFYDREFWNPSPVPLVSLLIGYCCYLLEHKKPLALLGLGVLVGLSFSIHLSLLIFLPYIIYLVWKTKKTYPKKTLALALMVILFFLAPIILFDLRHGFLNTKAALRLMQGNQITASASTLPQRGQVLFQSLGRFLWTGDEVDLFTLSGQCRELAHLMSSSWIPSVVMVLIMGWFLWKRKKTNQLPLYLVSAMIVFTLLYPRTLFEYYYLVLFPWMALIVGQLGDTFWSSHKQAPFVMIGVLLLFVILNLWTLFHATFSYSYRDKMNAIAFIQPFAQEQPYVLEALGECPRFGGWRYLVTYGIGKPPTHSYMDSYFSWLYPEKPGTEPVDRMVLLSMIDDRLDQQSMRQWQEKEQGFLTILSQVAQKQFGRITVTILDEQHE